MKKDGLLGALKDIATEKKIVVLSDSEDDESGDDYEEEDTEANKSQQESNIILLSDDEDGSDLEVTCDSTNAQNSVVSTFGGKCLQRRGSSHGNSSARSLLLNKLQKKTAKTTSESIAKKMGLESASDMFKVLQGLELER